MAKKRIKCKRKFKEVKVKLTPRQYASICNYAKSQNFTLNKYIRHRLKDFITGYEDKAPLLPKISASQMTVFEVMEDDELL